jgi:hypothetical protein
MENRGVVLGEVRELVKVCGLQTRLLYLTFLKPS